MGANQWYSIKESEEKRKNHLWPMKASSEKPNITAQKSAITPIQTVTCAQKENMCGTFKQSSLDF